MLPANFFTELRGDKGAHGRNERRRSALPILGVKVDVSVVGLRGPFVSARQERDVCALDDRPRDLPYPRWRIDNPLATVRVIPREDAASGVMRANTDLSPDSLADPIIQIRADEFRNPTFRDVGNGLNLSGDVHASGVYA